MNYDKSIMNVNDLKINIDLCDNELFSSDTDDTDTDTDIMSEMSYQDVDMKKEKQKTKKKIKKRVPYWAFAVLIFIPIIVMI